MPSPLSLRPPALRTRVARRVLLLFVLCALIPVSALAFFSYTSVRTQLLQESDNRLREMAKNAGVAVAERLQFLENSARLNLVPLVQTLGTGGGVGPPSGTLGAEVLEKFEAATLVRNGTRQPLFGEMAPPRDPAPMEEAHLGTGAALVRIEGTPPGKAGILLAMDMGSYGQPGARLWARLEDGYLWQTASGYSTLPGSAGLCVLGDLAAPLFCTFPDIDRFLAAFLGPEEGSGPAPSAASSRFLDWEGEDGTRYRAAIRDVFLRPQFGVQKLTISVSESRDHALSSMVSFQNTFMGVVILSLLAVASLSSVQIRKTLGPLHELRRGTERVAQGEFRARVEVHSGDEFEELAESFNLMGERLEGQFRALGTVGEIDRAILSALDTDRIVSVVLQKTSELLSCDQVGVCRLEWLGSKEGRLWTHDLGGQEGRNGRRILLSDEELRGLISSEGVLRGGDLGGVRNLLGGEPADESQGPVLLSPLRLPEGLAGYFFVAGPDGSGFSESDSDHFRRVSEQLAVALSNARLLEELDRMSWGALTALARAIDAKSPWTLGHSERVTSVAVVLGRALGLTEGSISNLKRGGLVHDIGKIGVPSRILDGRDPLTVEERRIIESHPEGGVRILEPIPAMEDILPLVFYHHESWDGSGYPMGLVGEAIPLEARVLAVADRFDAMTSERPYRTRAGLDEAAALIRAQAGTGLDPAIVAVFLDLLEQGRLPISGAVPKG